MGGWTGGRVHVSAKLCVQLVCGTGVGIYQDIVVHYLDFYSNICY